MERISEDYCDFETAKLLKEKGFNGILPFIYVDTEKSDREIHLTDTLCNYNDGHIKDVISAPTLQMAMKWLREIHKILILVEYDCPVFSSDIYKMDDIDEYGSAKHIPPTFANCKNYEQACEAAIKYYLENLITPS